MLGVIVGIEDKVRNDITKLLSVADLSMSTTFLVFVSDCCFVVLTVDEKSTLSLLLERSVYVKEEVSYFGLVVGFQYEVLISEDPVDFVLSV